MPTAKNNQKSRQNTKQDTPKKNNMVIIAIALVIVAASAFLFTLLGKMLWPEKTIVMDQTNKTFVVKGDVKVKKANGTGQWQKMDTSTVLEKGDVVEVARESSVDIVIGSNTEKAVGIGEKSTATFEGVNPTQINLSKGKVMVALKKLEPKSSFIIKTPSAICGARGTAWMQETDGGNTRVCVFESKIFAGKVDTNGKPDLWKQTVDEGTQRVVPKDGRISEPEKIPEKDQEAWGYWSDSIMALREGKVLVNNFDRKENFNNLGGEFGSWNIFYSDLNQYCRDEFSSTVREGDKGYSLKLSYSVDSPYSAYNGFFTNLMQIDLTDYKYLVLSIKGDSAAGFTTLVNLELKNQLQIGRATLDGITDEWKTFVIPLTKFAGLNGLQKMKELVIVFIDNKVTKKKGVIYIDNIYFSKTEPSGQPS